MAQSAVFISHITEEKALALKLKSLLRQVFGRDLPVFVSSDYVSIRGGAEWFSSIVNGVKTTPVVLVLVSADSVDRRWINFEAGVGIGARNTVIPLVVRSYAKADVPLPLAGLQLRDIHDPKDVAALIVEVGEVLGIAPARFDESLFIEEFTDVERGVPRETISFEPVIETQPGGRTLGFEIRNVGTVGLEIIELWISVPEAVKNPNWTFWPVPPALSVEQEKAPEGPRIRGRLLPGRESTPGSGYYRPDFQVLPNTITKGMSPYRVRALNFLIKEYLTPEEKNAVVRYGKRR